jgi:YVTN family beta-propeller protein
VANIGDDDRDGDVTDNTLSCIDAADPGQVVHMIVGPWKLRSGDKSSDVIPGIAIAPSGNPVYIVADGKVRPVDVISNLQEDTSISGANGFSQGIASSPARAEMSRIYVTNVGPFLTAIDLPQHRNDSFRKNFPVGSRPAAVAVSPPRGRWVYVSNSADGTVTMIDTAVGHVAETFASGRKPVGIAVLAPSISN